MKKVILAIILIFCLAGVTWAGEYAGMKDTVEVEPGLFLTVNSAKLTTSGFMEPENDVFLIFDCTFENKSNKPIHVSSALQLNIIDADGYQEDLSFSVKTKGSLDGIIANGQRMRGEIGFDVEAGTLIEFFSYKPLMGTPTLFKVDITPTLEAP